MEDKHSPVGRSLAQNLDSRTAEDDLHIIPGSESESTSQGQLSKNEQDIAQPPEEQKDAQVQNPPFQPTTHAAQEDNKVKTDHQVSKDESASPSPEKASGSVFGELPRFHLLISGLQPDILETHLSDIFVGFGNLENSFVFEDGNGVSLNTGILSFLDRESARRALNKAKTMFNSASPPRLVPHRSICVQNLDREVTEEKLTSLFENCGQVTEVIRPCDPLGRPIELAFVCFKEREALAKAVGLKLTVGSRKLKLQETGEINRVGRVLKLTSESKPPSSNTTGSLFGGGLFGASNQDNTGSGLFGSSPPKGNSSLFSGSFQNSSPKKEDIGSSSGLFGTFPNPQEVRSGDLFGLPKQEISPKKKTNSQAGGLFGNIQRQAGTEKNTNQGFGGGFGGGFGSGDKSLFSGQAKTNVSENNKAARTGVPAAKSRAQAMFEGLFASKKFADVTCVVQGEEILAHRVVLSENSQYFDDIISKENTSGESNMMRISIKDVKPNTFKALLEFLYCADVKADEELAEELLQLSEKYSISDLKLKCEDILSSLLTIENFVKISKIAEQFQTSQLRITLLNFTARHGADMIEKEEIGDLPKSILVDMIEKLCVSTQKSPQKSNIGLTFGSTQIPVNTTVYVGNMGQNLGPHDLRNLLINCGEIAEITMGTDDQGRERGFAHVRFTTPDAVARAVAMNGAVAMGRNLRIQVATGTKREDQGLRGGLFGGR